MSFHLPPPARHWSGPPESPWHESFPPAAYPAHIIVGWWNVLPYQSGRPQMSSGIRRTTTSRSLGALVYPTVMVTSVTETIQKAPLAEAQTAFYENKKMRSVERGYPSHNRNSVKNCFPTQNITEIGQSAAELWPAITDDWTHGAASRGTTAPTSDTIRLYTHSSRIRILRILKNC